MITDPRSQRRARRHLHPARERLQSYSGLNEARADVVRPETAADVRAVLDRARREGRRVTVRGAGLSLDDRALGDDLVVCTERLASIAVDTARCEVTVGPGATWGAILRSLPPGLVPAIVVTGSETTAGGTLASNSVSRFSCALGREADHVVAFDMITVSGQQIRCTQEGQHRDIFGAVTGGLGYLGVVTSITYSLLDLRHLLAGAGAATGVQVETQAERLTTFEALGEALLPRHDAPSPEGIFSFAFLDGRSVVHRSRYTAGARLRPMPIARRPSPPRLLLEALVWCPPIARLLWSFIYAVYYRLRTTFVDELFSFTFLMDTNARAAAFYRRRVGDVFFVQETYVIPASLRDRAASAARLASFLRDVATALAARGMEPNLFDVLYVRGSGYAVTAAFVTRDRARAAMLAVCLSELSRLCLAAGGYVHLVKNVHADPQTFAAMHGERLRRLLAAKRRLDPTGVLENAFFQRVVAAAAAPEGPPPSRNLGEMRRAA